MYIDHKGRFVFVYFNGEDYFPMVRTPGGRYLRYGSVALPNRKNREQAENDLTGYAKHMGWKPIQINEQPKEI